MTELLHYLTILGASARPMLNRALEFIDPRHVPEDSPPAARASRHESDERSELFAEIRRMTVEIARRDMRRDRTSSLGS